MTLSTGLIFGIVFLIMFIAVIATVAESLVKITAKRNGQNPENYGVLPNDLDSLFNRGGGAPSHVPVNEHYVKLKKGFDINLMGAASIEHKIELVRSATYALKPKDFMGMMPIPKVVPSDGDSLKAGDVLFFDKKRPEIKYASPVSGEMGRIQRGEKRSINEVVILASDEMEYRQYELPDLSSVSRADLIAFLLDSGAWPFIRQRPFDIVAESSISPKSIFVTTFDTAPLAPSFNLTVEGRAAEFQKGLDVLAMLTDGQVHLGLDGRGDQPAKCLYGCYRSCQTLV